MREQNVTDQDRRCGTELLGRRLLTVTRVGFVENVVVNEGRKMDKT